MNLLFLALYPPNPPVDGGRLRTYNILTQAARRHRVTLACFDDPIATEAYRAELGALCAEVVVVPKPAAGKRTTAAKVRDLGAREPIGLRAWQSPRMRDTIRDLSARDAFDAVHVDHLVLAQYAEDARTPWVLTHHNIEALAQARTRDVARTASPLVRWNRARELSRWRSYEIAISRRADALVAVSESEAAYFRAQAPGVPVFVVPNGVDTEFFRPAGGRGGDALLFTGSMDYAPNADAARWFCEAILPHLRKTHPACRTLLVGRDPTPEVRALTSRPGVTVTGRVDDVRPYYAQSAVFVAPLRAGGGTRLKILEAMAMALPVVTTQVGCEGLDVADGREVLIADTPENFAVAVARLLDDAPLRDRMGAAGRALVRERYDWERIGEAQEKAYWALKRQVSGRRTAKDMTRTE